MSAPSRRDILRLGLSAAAWAASGGLGPLARGAELPVFTGPGANPQWNAVGPYALHPQKLPLILLTDRPVQLETPRAFFLEAITPNAAFYVRWHLTGHPASVDLHAWRLTLSGRVKSPKQITYDALLRDFPKVDVVAVNQCSGNSRSHVVPRVAGSQWGHGAMGCARYTGVPLRALLDACKPDRAATTVQFEGGELGPGPATHGAHRFAKSIALDNPVIDACILAYAMNGAPLPHLNGFPLRLVVPGYYATYWVKAVQSIRLIEGPDDNYWQAKAYRLPDTPRGNITPAAAAKGGYPTVPIGRMPPRSFIITPDGSAKLPQGMPQMLRGIAFSGYGAIRQVEVSFGEDAKWVPAKVLPNEHPYGFYIWQMPWTPTLAGRTVLRVRATDSAGNTQDALPFWNPNGYGLSNIVEQEVMVAPAA